MRTGLVLVLVWLLCGLLARAEDWPTYRHDNGRTAVTREKLPLPLSEAWVFQARHAPSPAWEPPRAEPVEGILELPRVRFDDAYHVVSAGDAVYFGSSSDCKVYCLEAASGRVRWTFFTGGPVRLAPTVVRGLVYVGSDDGNVYCLSAADGAVVWQRRVGPRDERLLGHGRMISRWPIRTGVLVEGDIAYYGAGLFPSEGVYLEAVRAADGQLIWRNDTGGEATGSRLSYQGYLLASAAHLIVPQGRATPALFDRSNGKLIAQPTFGKTIGGTDAWLVNDTLYTGTEEILGYDPATRARVSWFAGRKVVVTPTVSYVATTNAMLALNPEQYSPLASAWLRLQAERTKLASELRTPATEVKRLTEAIAEDQAMLARATDPAERARLEREIRAQESRLATLTDQLEKSRQRLRSLDEKLKEADAAMSKAVRWRLECECPDSLILAGDVLFAGGQDQVIAVSASAGKKLWQGRVAGKAKGLAVANGRLYVSTDTGAIHCFSSADAAAAQRRITEPTNPAPYPPDTLAAQYAAAADTIVRESGVRRGHCLVVGCEIGRLAFELAKRTELQIIGIEPDPKKVAIARRALDAAGFYGARVTVDCGLLDRLPYSDFFANLVVSDTALFGALPNVQREVDRVLKPAGGVAMIGSLAQLKQSKIVRGPLHGAGSWTHQYGNAANTASSDETYLRCPLGLLWFGDPGPLRMPNRHVRAAAPLAVNGIMIVPSENEITAYDSYNGLKLWECRIPKVLRTRISADSSNVAADQHSVYVAVSNVCQRLDLQTGALLTTYNVPQQPGGSSRQWGHLAVTDNRIIGTATTPTNRASDLMFAYDLRTGRLAWTHLASNILQTSISAGEGSVFFVQAPPRTRRRKDSSAPIHRATALALADGKIIWQKDLDLSGCVDGKYWGALGTMLHDGVLVLFGVYTDGHYWKEFFAGQFNQRRILALNARDGSTLWAKNIPYRVRPLILGDTLHAEPWAFDLHTGAQRNRTNPITGRIEPWQFARPGHHCGAPVAAANVMFFRSYYLGYYDLAGDQGTMTFGGQRPGCWINFIPANGLAIMPEASSGCMCPFPIMCTVVLAPRNQNRAWAQYSTSGDIKPVRHLAINLGAPGDRRDEQGTLWLAYPRPKGSLVLDFKLDLKLQSGPTKTASRAKENPAHPAFPPALDSAYFAYSPDFLQITATSAPWLYTFGCRGLLRCHVPLLGPNDGPARYTVRLCFAEIEDRKPGERIFDIALQGRVMQRNFDIVREAGAARKAIVKEFTDIEVSGDLVLEFTPKTASLPPLLQAMEIVRQSDAQ
ncbi:MAG: PQQ-binding-like beta-propeller repeat protein [Verrucomicrobiae bacterium]|nr:PQQ-binding-like beta-propeller repeat protein [Verrucomicrobiae bacterium]